MPYKAIKVENLGKKYFISHRSALSNTSLRDALSEGVRAVRQRFLSPLRNSQTGCDIEEFWALQNVSFEVNQGEVVGIIGPNGAGKSTLLKILSRITEPTLGRVRLKGRVASLLEVGTGFHPELTGRENIFLNGAILGMSRREIIQKFDEIVDFAETQKFLDTPVKRYSSGMYVRLAFAVAAHLQSEILIVDEVLSVGDGAFQKKCLAKMNDVRSSGRTIIFVSHNMKAIQQLCTRALVLKEGILTVDTSPLEAVRYYRGTGIRQCVMERSWSGLDQCPGNDTVRLLNACLLSRDGSPASLVYTDEPLTVLLQLETIRGDAAFNVTVSVTNADGTILFASHDDAENEWHNRKRPPGIFKSYCSIPPNILAPGIHHVTLQAKTLHAPVRLHFREHEALTFEVLERPGAQGDIMRTIPGVVRPILKWKTEFSPSIRIQTPSQHRQS